MILVEPDARDQLAHQIALLKIGEHLEVEGGGYVERTACGFQAKTSARGRKLAPLTGAAQNAACDILTWKAS